MSKAKQINVSALTEHRLVIWMWFGITCTGVFVFAGLIILSHFVLYAPSIANNAASYKRAEVTLGFGGLGALAVAAFALLKFLDVLNRYHDQVFRQFVADNGWKVEKSFKLKRIPSVLL